MTQIFEPGAKHRTRRSRRIYAAYEIVYTFVDFGAAICFVVGSVMFFSEAWMRPGTWLFLIGSILFAAKPSIRLIRELRLMSEGRAADLAERAEAEP